MSNCAEAPIFLPVSTLRFNCIVLPCMLGKQSARVLRCYIAHVYKSLRLCISMCLLQLYTMLAQYFEHCNLICVYTCLHDDTQQMRTFLGVQPGTSLARVT